MSQKIVIVGAGLSGISAAAKLMENGYNDIVILEAENRIGGRVETVPFDGGFIDMGAQWCHGEGVNPIYNLVKDFFKFGDTGYDNTDITYYLSNGSLANQEQALLLEAFGYEINDDFTEMSKFKGSLAEFFILKYKEGLKKDPYNTLPADLASQMLDWFEKDALAFVGSQSWFDASAKLNALQEVLQTGNQYQTWLNKGYKTVFDFITVRYLEIFD